MSTVSPVCVRHRSSARRTLGALEALIAVSAAGGAVYGLSGAPGAKASWLDASPFTSYVIPSIVLLAAVGGSAALALAALLANSRRAATLATAAGTVLIGWIAVEVIWIPFSPLQPACLAAGVGMIALGRAIRRV